MSQEPKISQVSLIRALKKARAKLILNREMDPLAMALIDDAIMAREPNETEAFRANERQLLLEARRVSR